MHLAALGDLLIPDGAAALAVKGHRVLCSGRGGVDCPVGVNGGVGQKFRLCGNSRTAAGGGEPAAEGVALPDGGGERGQPAVLNGGAGGGDGSSVGPEGDHGGGKGVPAGIKGDVLIHGVDVKVPEVPAGALPVPVAEGKARLVGGRGTGGLVSCGDCLSVHLAAALAVKGDSMQLGPLGVEGEALVYLTGAEVPRGLAGAVLIPAAEDVSFAGGIGGFFDLAARGGLLGIHRAAAPAVKGDGLHLRPLGEERGASGYNILFKVPLGFEIAFAIPAVKTESLLGGVGRLGNFPGYREPLYRRTAAGVKVHRVLGHLLGIDSQMCDCQYVSLLIQPNDRDVFIVRRIAAVVHFNIVGSPAGGAQGHLLQCAAGVSGGGRMLIYAGKCLLYLPGHLGGRAELHAEAQTARAVGVLQNLIESIVLNRLIQTQVVNGKGVRAYPAGIVRFAENQPDLLVNFRVIGAGGLVAAPYRRGQGFLGDIRPEIQGGGEVCLRYADGGIQLGPAEERAAVQDDLRRDSGPAVRRYLPDGAAVFTAYVSVRLDGNLDMAGIGGVIFNQQGGAVAVDAAAVGGQSVHIPADTCYAGAAPDGKGAGLDADGGSSVDLGVLNGGVRHTRQIQADTLGSGVVPLRVVDLDAF